MEPITRRSFLGAAGAAVAAVSSPDPRPCPPAAWRKHGVVLQATEPWEGGDIQNFTCSAEPLERGRWRLWYSVSASKPGYTLAYAEGVPGEPMRKVPAVLSSGEPADAPFAIGGLPAGWRPVQGVHVRVADGLDRLYFWAHGPRVVRYLAADSSDGRRYRVVEPTRPVLVHPYDRMSAGVPTPDGSVLWNGDGSSLPTGESPARTQQVSNDATTVYRLPDGSFEFYSVGLVRVPASHPGYVAHDNVPGLLRVIDRYTSADGLRIDTRTRVVARDEADPGDQQFYYLSATHTPRGVVGMLGHYRVKAQTMDLEWCHSPDGVRWTRSRRQGWLPRGLPGEPDCYGIYAGSHLVQHQGAWHLFYTGVNSAHNGKHSYGEPRQVVMHATVGTIWDGA